LDQQQHDQRASLGPSAPQDLLLQDVHQQQQQQQQQQRRVPAAKRPARQPPGGQRGRCCWSGAVCGVYFQVDAAGAGA
jgi:hypothetical protein